VEEIAKAEAGLLVPGNSFANYWDMVVIVALLFTTFVTPYEVALLDVKLDGLFALNRCVDAVFLFDMYVNFHMVLFNEVGSAIRNKAIIRSRYLRGWFGLDFVSLLPYDLISLLTDSDS